MRFRLLVTSYSNCQCSLVGESASTVTYNISAFLTARLCILVTVMTALVSGESSRRLQYLFRVRRKLKVLGASGPLIMNARSPRARAIMINAYGLIQLGAVISITVAELM